MKERNTHRVSTASVCCCCFEIVALDLFTLHAEIGVSFGRAVYAPGHELFPSHESNPSLVRQMSSFLNSMVQKSTGIPTKMLMAKTIVDDGGVYPAAIIHN
jgi:hypothetical protein